MTEFKPDRNKKPLIIRGSVLNDGDFSHALIESKEGIIQAIHQSDDLTELERRTLIVPGFIDIHVHGGGGADVMDGSIEALRTIAETHVKYGTTGWLATTVTVAGADILRVIDAVKQYMPIQSGFKGAECLGIHLEGPFLSPKHRGAQREDLFMLPDLEQFQSWVERAEGIIRMITLAPELEGAERLIRYARENGITVSAGHTDATSRQLNNAAEWGVTHLTHVFNAMRPIHHREPGIIAAACRNGHMTADFIADGIHLHPDTENLLLRLFGHERLILITDAMRAACMGDGLYEIGGLPVTVKQGVARIDNGTLAGSLLTLQRAAQRMTNIHRLRWAEVSRMASYNPARLLGLDRKGGILPGKSADLVGLTSEGDVLWTMVNGELCYENGNNTSGNDQ
ncbi:N-acetylglucosamine-6-phosphate deacetylase [Ferviditalea candida]|uniref:N-acetylglucosamine-6-phosphate deacetylase n=1 Tax=Ferviditalea candida TaxID=3108399 RepID=A0ABU5ZN83_9BACL|nr:N-acetylglucosamine-6-phosphate deacetylase [Paenibacillaceae bacterium T2]